MKISQCIALNGIKIYAYHGYFEEEQIIGSWFTVDIKVYLDFEKAALTDNLEQTISYTDLFDIIKKEMTMPSKLLEHVAERISNKILHYERIQKLNLSIKKLNPPISSTIENACINIKYSK